MAYKKFDDATKAVSQAPRKVYEAVEHEDIRRALLSVLNRVVATTAGTAGTALQASLGTGSTCGVKLAGNMLLCINGRFGTAAAQDNIYLPAGTQAASTYVKYMVALAFGTNGTIFAGNEGASSTAAFLPDLPANYVCVGFVEYYSGTTGAFGRVGGGTSNSQNVLSGNTGGTAGTINAWVSLLHMPIWESAS